MAFHSIPIHPGLEAELAIRFDGTNWSDVTPYLRSFSTTISRSRALGVFPPGDATFVLDNRDGRFTPLNGSSPYAGDVYPGRHIRYRERYDGATYDVWYGIVEDWGDSYPQAKDGIATVRAYQPTKLLAAWRRSPLTTAVGTGETASSRVSRVLFDVAWSFGSSTLNGVVPLQGTLYERDAMSEIELAVRTELGAFWCEGDGSVRFEDRYALMTRTRSNTSQATFGPNDVPYVGEPTMSSGLDLVVNSYTAANRGQLAVTMTNAASVTELGQTLSDAATDLIGTDHNYAAGNADAMVRLYGLPVQYPTSITLKFGQSPSLSIPQALDRRIRDKVTVKIPTPWGATLSCPVWLVGVRNEGSPQQGRSTTFEFEPATNYEGLTLFTLDTSSLDGSHILGW